MSGLNFDHKLINVLERQAQPLLGLDNDYDAIIQAAQGNASGKAKGRIFVLIGGATHGTAEFYRIRAEITQRLIMAGMVDAVGTFAPSVTQTNVDATWSPVGQSAVAASIRAMPLLGVCLVPCIGRAGRAGQVGAGRRRRTARADRRPVEGRGRPSHPGRYNADGDALREPSYVSGGSRA